MNRNIAVTCDLMAIVLLTGGCSGGNGTVPIDSTPVTTTGQYGVLQFALTMRTSHQRGEAVPMTLTVTNTGTQTVETLGGVPWDFAVTQGNRLVYQDTRVRGEIGAFTPLAFAPGQSRTYDFTWDQKDMTSPRQPVPPGRYSVKAWLNAFRIDGVDLPFANLGNLLNAVPVQITIQ